MDFNQQLELELNQPVQNRNGSRRCHSRLAEALAYVTSHLERAASANVTSRSEPEQVASAESLSGKADSLRTTISDIDTVARLDFKRTYSDIVKTTFPTSYRLDKIPLKGSALVSPEPSLFTMAYRIKDSPSPSTASLLPPIKFSQHEQELKLQQPQLDNNKNKKKFEYFEIGLEESNIQPKPRGKENNKPEHIPKLQQQHLDNKKNFEYFEIWLEESDIEAITPEKNEPKALEKEIQPEQQQLDSNKNKKKFEYFEIGLEARDTDPKAPEKKENKKFQYFEIGMEKSHVEPKPLEKEIIQPEQELKLQQQQLDSNKNKKKFEYFENVIEARDTDPQTPEKKYLEIGFETSYIELKPFEKETEFHDDVQTQEGDIEQKQTKDLEVQQKKEKNDTQTESVRVLDPLIPNYVQKEASKELQTYFSRNRKYDSNKSQGTAE